MRAGEEAYQQSNYPDAEKHFRAALEEAETFPAEDVRLATNLNNLGSLYYSQGKHADAVPLFERALTIWQKTLGSEHPDVATSLNNLATLYRNQRKYDSAETLIKQALVIQEKVLGSEHPDVATRTGLKNTSA
jgi:tetratricopeptide (TPR) repeat protein